MKKNIESAIKEYQCSGCMLTCNPNSNNRDETGGEGCGKHFVGTYMSGVGKILLGLPKGFNRLSEQIKLRPCIFEKFSDGWGYDKFNIPVWKYLTFNNHTVVRGISPRLNTPFIHIFLEDCMDKIDCLQITDEDKNEMD